MVSDRFLEEITRSHDVEAYVELTTTNHNVVTLRATDGEVSVDRSATYRRTMSITCVDPLGEITPEGPHSDLSPFGNAELRPYRGVRYSDGTVELAPLGVFRLSKVNIKDDESGGVTLNLEAFDKSRTISRKKFVDAYLIESGTNVVAAIKAMVQRVFPDVEYDSISTAAVTTAPKLYETKDDPWKAITELALSIGCDAYFDVYGRFVIAPDVDVTTNPVYRYVEGDRCTMLNLERELNDEPGFNGVVVEASSVGDEAEPIRAVVWDTDPSSPTYYLGPYGQVPMVYQDSVSKTVEEAQIVGMQILRTLLGADVQVTSSAIVNPALEGGVVVQVERAAAHVTGNFTVEAFNVPMVSHVQNLELRQKRDK